MVPGGQRPQQDEAVAAVRLREGGSSGLEEGEGGTPGDTEGNGLCRMGFIERGRRV